LDSWQHHHTQLGVAAWLVQSQGMQAGWPYSAAASVVFAVSGSQNAYLTSLDRKLTKHHCSAGFLDSRDADICSAAQAAFRCHEVQD